MVPYQLFLKMFETALLSSWCPLVAVGGQNVREDFVPFILDQELLFFFLVQEGKSLGHLQDECSLQYCDDLHAFVWPFSQLVLLLVVAVEATEPYSSQGGHFRPV